MAKWSPVSDASTRPCSWPPGLLSHGMEPQSSDSRFEQPQSLLLDHDKPRSDDRTLWTAALAFRCWRRVSGWRRSGTALGLEKVPVMRHWINCDGLRAGERVDRGNSRVLVGRILVDDGDVALASIRN